MWLYHQSLEGGKGGVESEVGQPSESDTILKDHLQLFIDKKYDFFSMMFIVKSESYSYVNSFL